MAAAKPRRQLNNDRFKIFTGNANRPLAEEICSELECDLGAADVKLDRQLLDQIDEIVPPGTTFNPVDRGWTPPSLASTELRRRRLS